MKRLIAGVGALILAPIVLVQCATALYNGLILGDFIYVGIIANSIEFAAECILLNLTAILMLIWGEDE